MKTEGDALFVAFADATDAIEAPADAAIRVRMGSTPLRVLPADRHNPPAPR